MTFRKVMFVIMGASTLAFVLPGDAQEGPSKFSGHNKFDNVKLKSGTASDTSLDQWHSDISKAQRKSRTISRSDTSLDQWHSDVSKAQRKSRTISKKPNQ
jgi:hypothetical protein